MRSRSKTAQTARFPRVPGVAWGRVVSGSLGPFQGRFEANRVITKTANDPAFCQSATGNGRNRVIRAVSEPPLSGLYPTGEIGKERAVDKVRFQTALMTLPTGISSRGR